MSVAEPERVPEPETEPGQVTETAVQSETTTKAPFQQMRSTRYLMDLVAPEMRRMPERHRVSVMDYMAHVAKQRQAESTQSTPAPIEDDQEDAMNYDAAAAAAFFHPHNLESGDVSRLVTLASDRHVAETLRILATRQTEKEREYLARRLDIQTKYKYVLDALANDTGDEATAIKVHMPTLYLSRPITN